MKVPSGSVYRPVYKDRHGERCTSRIWWCCYYVQGKPVRESCQTEDCNEAKKFLRGRLATADLHKLSQDRVTVGQLLDLVLEDYKTHNRGSLPDLKSKIESRLGPFFGKMKAAQLGTIDIKGYQTARLRERAAPASVNRELAVVRRALNLGAHHDPPLVSHVPRFDFLPVDNAREGTITHDQYQALRDALPRHARCALVIAYHCGCRRGEIFKVERRHIDFHDKRILMPGRTTKNRQPKYIPIYGDMAEEIKAAMDESDAEACEAKRKPCPYLIQWRGQAVSSLYTAWDKACKALGLEGTLLHDMRRVAATNMIEAGLSEHEAMEITGHKTPEIFRRYHIVSAKRMAVNAEKLAAHLAAKGGDSSVNRTPEI